MHAPRPRTFRILHVVRAPVGGLFRHICDLGSGQAERGHAVGLIADSMSGGESAEMVLRALAPKFSLGIERVPIARSPDPSDLIGLLRLRAAIRKLKPDVVHGHGAKGGAFARLAPVGKEAIRAYTPHGGSLHYRPGTPVGAMYAAIERLLIPRTDIILFESDYARRTYLTNIGTPNSLVHVVCNGIAAADLEPVRPADDATDLVFVGELRKLKGIDVLLIALALLHQRGRQITLTIAGEGPHGRTIMADCQRLGLAGAVHFIGYRKAREAFALGRILVVPSRSESLPYVVLEAAAAGIPIIATAVGGIPEIFGPDAHRLVPPEDVEALSTAIVQALDDVDATKASAKALHDRVRDRFSVERMIDGVLDGYRDAFTERFLTAQ